MPARRDAKTTMINLNGTLETFSKQNMQSALSCIARTQSTVNGTILLTYRHTWITEQLRRRTGTMDVTRLFAKQCSRNTPKECQGKRLKKKLHPDSSKHKLDRIKQNE